MPSYRLQTVQYSVAAFPWKILVTLSFRYNSHFLRIAFSSVSYSLNFFFSALLVHILLLSIFLGDYPLIHQSHLWKEIERCKVRELIFHKAGNAFWNLSRIGLLVPHKSETFLRPPQVFIFLLSVWCILSL